MTNESALDPIDTWSRSMLELDSKEIDPDWGAIQDVVLDMTQIEKMDFLRARIGSPRLDKMDRDEYNGVIEEWLLEEWPELPITENVGALEINAYREKNGIES